MEEDISENSVKTEKTSMLPIFGLLGLGVGIVGCALAVFALVKIGDTTTELNEKIDKAAVAALETKAISDRIDSLAIQVEGLKSGGNQKVDALTRQVQDALNRVQEGMNKLAEEISNNRSAIEKVASRAPVARPVAKESDSSQSADSSASANTESNSSNKIHKIQAGDTFGKLAKKYNTTIEAIVRANPNLNPNRLQVNQEVAIP